jgi:hypothetical protein
MIRTARDTAAAILSAAFVLAAASSTAATAASSTTTDKNSDLTYYRGFDDQEPQLLGHVQSVRSGVDVHSFKITQGAKYVSIRFAVVHLQDARPTAIVVLQRNKRSGTRDWSATFRVTTPVVPTGSVHTGTVTRPGEDDAVCSVDVRVTSATHGTVYAQIPRTCLGDPSTLRAEAWLSRYYKPADDTSEERQYERTWYDSVSAIHYRSADFTPWIKSS